MQTVAAGTGLACTDTGPSTLRGKCIRTSLTKKTYIQQWMAYKMKLIVYLEVCCLILPCFEHLLLFCHGFQLSYLLWVLCVSQHVYLLGFMF